MLQTFCAGGSYEAEEFIRDIRRAWARYDGADAATRKLDLLLARYYDPDRREVVTGLLSLAASSTRSTGENIFKLLDRELTAQGTPWDNCLSFGCDNANVMVGLHKGVAAFIKGRNKNIIIQGCPCLFLHIAAKNANKKLSIDMESVLIDIYFYFDKSTKRQQHFADLCNETGEVVRKILKHGATRWLSLDTCNRRLIDLFGSLSTFFNELDKAKATAREERLISFFQNPLSKVYCLFLKFILPQFTLTNVFLQKEEPMIHLMQDKILDLLMELAVSFITHHAIKNCQSLLTLDYSDPLSPEILEASRIDKAWALISDITDCEDQPKYPLLSGAALGLLVVPHSNASCERIFSLVRKCKTEQRLHVQQSLSKPHHPKS